MDSICISKTNRLKGIVNISGSKNASLPIICASLLVKRVELINVPRIDDVKRLLRILIHLGSKISWQKNKLIINNENLKYRTLNIEDCKKIRGSYYLIPIMLYLFKKCEIALPGGCQIGARPIDAHIDVIKAMGYDINGSDVLTITEGNKVSEFNYKMIKESVGASINAILLAISTKYAVLDNLLIEPEGECLIDFLRLIGYKIESFNKRAVFKGKLFDVDYIKFQIIPDRMEAMTFVIMGLLCGEIKIKNISLNSIKYPYKLLTSNGYNVTYDGKYITAKETRGVSFDISTAGYPFLPTDMQPLFGVLLAHSRGSCVVEENIFEDRMDIYYDINKAKGNVNIIGNKAYIIGSDKLEANDYTARDLRHSAALMLLILKNGGTINNLSILERGYEGFLHKIRKLGANFKLK